MHYGWPSIATHLLPSDYQQQQQQLASLAVTPSARDAPCCIIEKPLASTNYRRPSSNPLVF